MSKNDMDKIREYTRQQINVSTISNFDTIQKGDNLVWDFSVGDSKMSFKKKGSELKGMLMGKRFKVLEKIEYYRQRLGQIKEQLDEQGVEISDGGNMMWDGDNQKELGRYYHEKHKLEGCEEDLKVIDVMLENVEDSKTYTLTVRQLSALK